MREHEAASGSGYAQATGERAGPAGGPGPSTLPSASSGGWRHDSPAPLAAFARRQSREAGAARPGAMRNRFEPSQVAQAGFEPGRMAVVQRASGCYCEPARSERLWRPPPGGQPSESRRKAGQQERSYRGDPRARQARLKAPTTPAIPRRGPLACERKAT
jgi:hypothetical protein